MQYLNTVSKSLSKKQTETSTDLQNKHQELKNETFDLSLVKHEAFEPLQSSLEHTNQHMNEHHHPFYPNLNQSEPSTETNALKGTSNQSEAEKPNCENLLNSNLNNSSTLKSLSSTQFSPFNVSSVPASNKAIFPNVVIYLNPNYDCGKFINTVKFHKSHTRFGPGLAPNVYKSILQSFVDCAINRYDVFKMIPEGNGVDFVRYKTSTHSERKNKSC